MLTTEQTNPIFRHTRKRRVSAPRGVATRRLAGGRRDAILHIDDDPDYCRLTAFMLQRAGIAVHSCCEPAEAIREVERARPSLVLLDLHMPPYSGIELLSDLRRRWATLPVVILSASKCRDARRRAIAGGVVRCLHKPTADWDTVVRLIKRSSAEAVSTRKRRRADSAGQPAKRPHAGFPCHES